MSEEVLAVIEASPPRRWLGIGMLSGVGTLSIYVALATPPEPLWQIFLIVIGALALWMGARMYRATQHRIELTETELRSSDGTRIALIDGIEAIDRGTFAFKPSNGFLLRLSEPGDAIWQPGLWWRIDRRVGVGGVVAGSQTKFMAEALTTMLARRRGDI